MLSLRGCGLAGAMFHETQGRRLSRVSESASGKANPMNFLIAIGGASCAWDDYEQAKELCPDADIGAVNEAARDFPGRLSLFVTLHAEKLGAWQRQRECKGLNTDYTACSNKGHFDARIDFVTNEVWSGSSGLFLCQVAAIKFRYTRIICCGIPIDERPHYFDKKEWSGVSRYRRGWIEAMQQPELKGKVRSMSGWTRELTGEPTTEWLAVPA